MPQEVQEKASTRTNRISSAPFIRRLTTTTTLLLGSVFAAGDNIASVQAQPPSKGSRPAATAGENVVVSKLSANELLRMLPDSFPVKSEFGKEATVEKCEVIDAKYLAVVLRNIHEPADGSEQHELIKKVVVASDDEIGQIMCELNEKYGFHYFGSEGFSFTHYTERMKALRSLPDYERQVRNLEKKAFGSASHTDQKNAREARDLFDNALAEMKIHAPFAGLFELEREGKAELVPTESIYADRASGKEMRKPFGERNDMIIFDNREDACLLFLHRALSYRKANRVAMAWGAAHWKVSVNAEAPRRAIIWNREHPENKFSFAIITPPSVFEYEEAEKLAEKWRREGREK